MIARALRPLLLLALCLSGGFAAVSHPPRDSVDLVVWNRQLVTFRSPGSFVSVRERAERAAERIAQLPEEALMLPIEAKAATMGTMNGMMISAGPHFLFAVAEADLDLDAGETVDRVVQPAMARTRELFAARIESRSKDVALRGSLQAGLSTMLLAVVLFACWRFHRVIFRRLSPAIFTRMPSVLGLDLRPALLAMARSLLRLPFVALSLSATYLWLTFVFNCFPYTRPWSRALGAWLMDLASMIMNGILSALPGLFIVAVIMLLARYATRALEVFFSGVEEGRLEIGWMQPETARATRRISSVLVWLFAITVSYPYLPGSSSDAFKGVSVFAGLILTLGSSGMVSQVMSGLMVVYARSMRPGDIVKVGEVTGEVLDLGLLATKVRTPRGEEVAIPNSVLVGSTVTNHSRHDADGMVVHTTVTIGYDTPWRQVQALLMLAASRTPGIRSAPAPFVVQTALDDFYVAYELRARMEADASLFRVRSALHGQILDAFNEHGVQIMSPHFEAQPAQAVVVPKGGWTPAPA